MAIPFALLAIRKVVDLFRCGNVENYHPKPDKDCHEKYSRKMTRGLNYHVAEPALSTKTLDRRYIYTQAKQQTRINFIRDCYMFFISIGAGNY